jgi:hypothetical protein
MGLLFPEQNLPVKYPLPGFDRNDADARLIHAKINSILVETIRMRTLRFI